MQDRHAAYRKRQAKHGFRRVTIMTHLDDIERLKKYAARLRKEKRNAK